MLNRRSERTLRNKGLRRGAAAVEFAIIAPLFFLLLAGIIEFGQAFRIQHMLSNASRRGARAAAVDGATKVEVVGAVKTHISQVLGVAENNVSVKVAVDGITSESLTQAGPGDAVSVSVSIPYAKAGVGFYANLFSRSTFESTCTLEHE